MQLNFHLNDYHINPIQLNVYTYNIHSYVTLILFPSLSIKHVHVSSISMNKFQQTYMQMYMYKLPPLLQKQHVDEEQKIFI